MHETIEAGIEPTTFSVWSASEIRSVTVHDGLDNINNINKIKIKPERKRERVRGRERKRERMREIDR